MGGLVPALTQETLDNQREVVKNERRQRYENVPYGDAWRACCRCSTRRAPVPPRHHRLDGRPGRRRPGHLPGLLPHLLRAEQRGADGRRRRPAGGGVRAGREVLRRPAGAPDIPPAPDGTLPRATAGPIAESVVADVPAPRVYLAHRSYPFGTPGYDATTVLAAVLGQGRGSRIYRQLVDGSRLAQPDSARAYGVDLAHAPAPLIATVTARPGVGRDADLRTGRGPRRAGPRRGYRGRGGPGQGHAHHQVVAADVHCGRSGGRAEPVRHAVRRPDAGRRPAARLAGGHRRTR